VEFEGKCHFCGGDTVITEIKCKNCNTLIKGEFDVCYLCKLSKESKEFIKVFVECDGNIKNVEKVLGISYPTVKSRLAFVQEELRNLGASSNSYSQYNEDISTQNPKRKSILKNLEKGNLTVEEALKLLNDDNED
jgi:hypothetical protein